MRKYYNLRTREDNKPMLLPGGSKVIGLEFNTDSQEMEVCIEYDENWCMGGGPGKLKKYSVEISP